MVGCDRQDVRAYRVPRVTNQTPMMTAQGPGQVAQAGQAMAEQKVIWDVPSDWRFDPAPKQFRIATFVAQPGDVEISVAAFAGAAGGLAANVNRWRGQIQLPPVSEDEIEETLETHTASNHAIRVLDITSGQRLLAAIVQPGDGQTWFVKAQGEPVLVGRVRDALIEFALSIRLDGQATSQASATESVPMAAGTPANASSIENAIMRWPPPPGWSRLEQPSQMVAAVWATESGCRVTLTPLRGPGADLLPSVNMWRSQLGLTQVQDPSQVELTRISPSASMFDERTADGSLRILVATIAKPSRSWFLKLTGSAEAAESELRHLTALAELIDATEDDTP